MAWLCLALYLSPCCSQACPSTLSASLPGLASLGLLSSVPLGVSLPRPLPLSPCLSGLVCVCSRSLGCVWLCPPVYLPVVSPANYWA